MYRKNSNKDCYAIVVKQQLRLTYWKRKAALLVPPFPYILNFKDVRAKIEFFSANFIIERWWVSDVRNVKKWGATDFVLERTCPEEHLHLSKSDFVSEESHSGYKSRNISVRALKGNVLCQIWLKWAWANLVNWWGSSKNKFVFSDHSFTSIAAARWQDSMSLGQKSWIFFNFPNGNVTWKQCQ